jgi:uncharacterized protein YjdB
VGATTRLTAFVENATSSAVIWQSSNLSVANVDGNGNVMGVGVGSAFVTATAVAGNGASASAAITVTSPATPSCGEATVSVPGTVSGTLSSSDCRLADGSYYDRWRFTLASQSAIVIDLTSSAFDTYLALVNAAGTVVATDDDSGNGENARISTTLPPGTYVIFATSFDAGKVGPYSLSVQAGGGSSVSVQVSPSSRNMTVGETFAFQAIVTGTSDARVTWSSSATGVATIDGAGIVRASGPGTATIRATSLAVPTASGTATVTVTSGQSSTIEIVVTNSLHNDVNITINGIVVGSVPPRSTRQTQIQWTASVAMSWSLVRTTTTNGIPVGDVIGGNFEPVSNPGQRINYTIDAIVGQSFIFRPIIVNQTGTTLLMGVNEGLQSQNRCNCTVAPGSSGTVIGYYRLFSNSNVRAYRDGSGYTGGYIYWSNFASSVDPSSGDIRLNATIAPGADIAAARQGSIGAEWLEQAPIPPSDVLDAFAPVPPEGELESQRPPLNAIRAQSAGPRIAKFPKVVRLQP